jgi:predicted MFS family arabinose efflux permease
MPKPTGSSRIPSTARSGVATDTLRGLRTCFVLVLMMDLLCRTGYQMGKSPVLPLFAKSLGAGAGASGAIVAISTIAGLLASPVIGTLSDIYGGRRLLLVGTGLFASVPFVYLWVHTPGSTLGVLDVMDNVGKALGPIVAGVLLGAFSYALAFTIIASVLVAVELLLLVLGRHIG